MSGQVECLDATPQQGPKILSDGKDHGWDQEVPRGTEALAPDTGLCPLLRAHELRRLRTDGVIEVPYEASPGLLTRNATSYILPP